MLTIKLINKKLNIKDFLIYKLRKQEQEDTGYKILYDL